MLALVVVLTTSVATPALGQPGIEPQPVQLAPASVETETKWYGWQIAILDGVSGMIYLSTFAEGNPTFGRGLLGFTAAMGYAGGGGAHGFSSLPRMFLSTALRVGAVTGAFLLASETDLGRRDFALYLPLIAVSALDIGVLARRERPVRGEGGVQPYVTPLGTNGVGFGVALAY